MTENISLRQLCIRALADSEISSDEIRRRLQLFENIGDQDDPAYAIMLELHLLHMAQDRRLESEVKRDEAMNERMAALLENHYDRLLAVVVRQQVVHRQQFRRMIAIHRERFANRLAYVAAVLLLALFAGIGVFHFCGWIF